MHVVYLVDPAPSALLEPQDLYHQHVIVIGALALGPFSVVLSEAPVGAGLVNRAVDKTQPGNVL